MKRQSVLGVDVHTTFHIGICLWSELVNLSNNIKDLRLIISDLNEIVDEKMEGM